MSIPSKPTLTELQGQYLAFIYAYSKINRRPPAEMDMQRFFDVTPDPATEWSMSSKAKNSSGERRGMHEAWSSSSTTATSRCSDEPAPIQVSAFIDRSTRF